MPSLFRRKPAEVAADPEPDAAAEAATDEKSPSRSRPARGYTPSKRELGKTTPKRPSATSRRSAEPPPANRREALKRMRARQREERAEQRAGMIAGEERYLLPRDRGAERALTRDIVDSRWTLGTWFFSFAIILFLGTTFARATPPVVIIVLNAVWALLGLAVVVDSYLICRKVRRLVLERFPKSTQRMRGLYMYAIMRAITYRRLRMPKPRVKPGAKI